MLVPWYTLEGLRIMASSCASRGIAVTIALALHNLPEGMAVASPIIASGGSSYDALLWTFLSSVAEPLGAVLFGLVFNRFFTIQVAAMVNSTVAGIMIMLCIVELLPTAAAMTNPRDAALSNAIGQFVMFISVQTMISAGMH